MPKYKHYGLSLLELLISLIISGVLFLAAYAVLHHSLHSSKKLELTIHKQQSIRYAQYVLTKAIRMAGYFGCHRLQHSQIYSNLKNLSALKTYNQQLPSAFYAQTTKESDSLFVYHLAANAVQLNHAMPTPFSEILMPQKLVKRDNIIVIGDCQQTDIFSASQVTGKHNIKIWHQLSKLNATDQFSKAYPAGSYIGAFVADQFYIHNHGLYEKQINNRSEELLTGINSMRLYFSSHQKPTRYLASKQYHAWNNVAFVKVDLILQQHKTWQFIVRARN